MSQATAPIRHTDRFFIGGQWVAPSSDATISVIDSDTEQVYFTVAEAQAADISRAVEAAREAFDNGPWPRLTHEQRAEYLRAIGAELSSGPRTSARSGRASPACCTPSPATAASARAGDLQRVRRAGRHVPVRGAGQAVGRAVRPARPRAGRRRRRDHPVERADGPDQLQGRARAAGRLHRDPQVVARGAGRGLPDRGGGRGRRPAGRRAQRGHRRPRGVRAAGPRPAGRQDHLHRVDRRRAADRLDLRRADRPLHARTRRQVRGRHPRRRGHRDRRRAPCPRRSASCPGRSAPR